ncbi:MAG: flagellar filament capping protein FliD [Rhodocyclales bacterium]|nr:flagellar filament capping protein FliD [Rhodocyclales bacterium]
MADPEYVVTPVSGVAGSSAAPRLLSGLAGQAAVAPPNGVSSLVELSGLGQVLAAVATFETAVTPLRPAVGGAGGIAQNFGGDFAGVASAAQSFVGAFNDLQNTLGSLRQAATGGLTGSLLAGQVAAAVDRQATGALANGSSGLTTLEQIGIVFQVSPFGGEGGTLSVDRAQLETAFAADASGTVSLLEQAAQQLGTQTAGLAGDSGNATMLRRLIQSFGSTEQTQSLLGGGQAGAGQVGLSELFALESANLGNAEGAATLGRQLVGLRQYLFTSSLLG